MRVQTAWTRVVADYAHAIGIADYGDELPGDASAYERERGEASVVDTREIIAVTASWARDGYNPPTYLARVTFTLRGDEGPFTAFMAKGLPTLEVASRLAHLQAAKLARACGLLGYLDEWRGPWPTPDHEVLVREIEAELAELASQTRTGGKA